MQRRGGQECNLEPTSAGSHGFARTFWSSVIARVILRGYRSMPAMSAWPNLRSLLSFSSNVLMTTALRPA